MIQNFHFYFFFVTKNIFYVQFKNLYGPLEDSKQ